MLKGIDLLSRAVLHNIRRINRHEQEAGDEKATLKYRSIGEECMFIAQNLVTSYKTAKCF